MALKDWKLVVNLKHKKHWKNKLEDEKEVMIIPKNFNYPNKEWEFHYIEPIDNPYKLSTWKVRVFPNKILALKYARIYMETN